MSILLKPSQALSTPARRRFMGQSGLVLSGAAIALLSGKEALAAQTGTGGASQDIQILNTALAAELEAIAAYQAGAESKLLKKPVLDVALSFQGHHKEHADMLSKTIEKLGGKPVPAKTAYNFPLDQLKSQNDVLRFAARLEYGAMRRAASRSMRDAWPAMRWPMTAWGRATAVSSGGARARCTASTTRTP